MPDTRRRRSRFRRATDNLPGLRITPRDLSLLRHLAAHRFLRSSHFPDLVGGSLQGILRRLALLYHHGYIERPRAQLDGYFRLAGSAPIVYSLAPRGAALLRSHGMPFEEMAWTRQRPSAIGTLFLHHALLVADCAIGAETSCRTHAAAFRPLRELDLPAEPTPPPRGRGSWSVRVDPSIVVGVVPDAIFAVEGADGAACLYVLEADRGTMPVHRDGLDQSSFHRKLLAYRATWKEGLHRERFGFSRSRVLTATSSSARRDHLLAACAALPGGRRLFLSADARELRDHGDFLTFPWSSPTLTRREIRLLAVPGKAIAVTGMRRSGKTCFLWQCLGDLLRAGVPRESLVFLNFRGRAPRGDGHLAPLVPARRIVSAPSGVSRSFLRHLFPRRDPTRPRLGGLRPTDPGQRERAPIPLRILGLDAQPRGRHQHAGPGHGSHRLSLQLPGGPRAPRPASGSGLGPVGQGTALPPPEGLSRLPRDGRIPRDPGIDLRDRRPLLQG